VLFNNEIQPVHFVKLIESVIGNLEGKVAAFLGLSFKPNTGDIRETRALPIIEKLYNRGAGVRAYDPKAMDNFRRLTDLPIKYCESGKEALQGSDFAVIQADWEEIRKLSSEDYRDLLKVPIIFDGRRTYDPEVMISQGIKYYSIGWKNI
jgi:UDPglucose 6-dehydrogenase